MMKLKIASNDSYKPEQRNILKAYVGHEITLGKLVELSRRVPVAIVAAESDDSTLAIDSPESW